MNLKNVHEINFKFFIVVLLFILKWQINFTRFTRNAYLGIINN